MLGDIAKKWMQTLFCRVIYDDERDAALRDLEALQAENKRLATVATDALVKQVKDGRSIPDNQATIAKLVEAQETDKNKIALLADQLAQAEADKTVLMEALKWYGDKERYKVEFVSPPGVTYWRGGEAIEDAGSRAQEAIAKIRGE